MQDKYHAMNGSSPVNLSALRTDLNTVMTGNYTFRGVKKFSNTPQITAPVNTDNENNIPNVKLVHEMIDDNAGFMAENQWLPMDPMNGTYYTAYDENDSSPK